MNFYKHYIGDFQRDTGHLSLIERGAYLALIHHYYATEKPLPNSLDALCRIAGAVSKSERAAVKTVMTFFVVVNSGLMHNRIEAEIEKAGEISNTNREIALEREAKRRAAKEARTDQEHGTIRAESVPRSRHVQSTNQTPDTRLSNITTTTKPDNTWLAEENSPPTLTDIENSKQNPIKPPVTEDKKPETPVNTGQDAITIRSIEISIMLRRSGAALTASDPNVRRWAETGLSDGKLMTAMETAQANRAAASSPQPINSGYLDSILRGASDPTPPPPKRKQTENFASKNYGKSRLI